MKGIALGHKALDQFLEVGLTLGAITLFRVQGAALSRNEIDLFGELMRYETGQSTLSVFTKLRRLQVKSKDRYHVIIVLSNSIEQANIYTYMRFQKLSLVYPNLHLVSQHVIGNSVLFESLTRKYSPRRRGIRQ